MAYGKTIEMRHMVFQNRYSPWAGVRPAVVRDRSLTGKARIKRRKEINKLRNAPLDGPSLNTEPSESIEAKETLGAIA